MSSENRQGYVEIWHPINRRYERLSFTRGSEFDRRRTSDSRLESTERISSLSETDTRTSTYVAFSDTSGGQFSEQSVPLPPQPDADYSPENP